MSKEQLKYYWVIFSKLAKHRLSLLVSFSGAVGFLLASGRGIIDFTLLFLGVYLMSAGASALNQYQEHNLDSQMDRTKDRPIPAGQISPLNVVYLSIFLIIAGTGLLLTSGTLAAILGLSNVVLYNLIYTPLKIRSALSIIPGAIVGAIPPLMGWTFAGGSILHPTIIYIAIFMFLWQLPHFWLLLIMLDKEYKKAGFSSISKFFNPNQIKNIVFFWAGVTSVFLFFFPVFNIHLPTILAIILIATNLFFIFWFYRLIYGKEEKKSVRNAFILINSYLVLSLLIFIVNSFV